MSIKPSDDEAVPILEAEIAVDTDPPVDAPPSADELIDAEVSEAVRIEFASAFERVKHRPLAVDVVVLNGLKRTRHYIVARELHRLPQASNLDELKDALLETWAALLRLQIFDAVDVVIDEGRQTPDGSNGCTVVLNCKEKSRLNASVGTYVQGQEGQVELSFSLTNLLGVAETATLTGQYGSASSNELAITLAKPRPFSYPVQTELLLLQQSNNFQKFSSFTERLQGGIFSVSSEDQRHSLSYELAWRTLADPSHKCSPGVRAQLGGSLKSALRYVLRQETLDDPFFPLSGYSVRSTSELGGLWPGANVPRYGQQRLHGQLILPVTDSAAVALTAEAGLLLPLAARPSSQTTCISDRFFLGGISNGLQGFKFKGAGPMDRRLDRGQGQGARQYDALGGDLFGSVMAALRFQLPSVRLQSLGIFGHAFVNGGSAVLVGGTGNDARRTLQDFGSQFRWTAGVGLVWPTAVGQLEVNLCRVLLAQSHDQYRHGIHIGFGPRS